jgi:hypothetical protein
MLLWLCLSLNSRRLRLITLKTYKTLKLFPLKICTSTNFVVSLRSNNQLKFNNMKKLFLFLLSLSLCSIGLPVLAQDTELVPAMVVQMADGSKQVVELDYTSVTDFSVLSSKGSLAVSVPEADVTGVRSIMFVMVNPNEITALEEVQTLEQATTDKVLLNGKLFIRATMPDGKQVWYDVLGLKL